MKNTLEGLAKQAQLPVDNVPAKLTENEYVVPADVVVAIGKGDSEKGVAFFDSIVQRVRQATQSKMSQALS